MGLKSIITGFFAAAGVAGQLTAASANELAPPDVQGTDSSCGFAAEVPLVKIPLDLIDPNSNPDAYAGLATIGEINNTFAGEFNDYIGALPEGKPDFFMINSAGGSVLAAESMANSTVGRQEVVFVGVAESAATAFVSHVDTVYANSDSTMMFHQGRINKDENVLQENPFILRDLKILTGKEDNFVVEDFEALHAALVEGGGSDDYKGYAEMTAELLNDANAYFIESFQHENPLMTADCAQELLFNGDTEVDAIGMLTLGFADSVVLPGETMLVRLDDPRVQAFMEEKPDEFKALNPGFVESAEAETKKSGPIQSRHL